MRGIIYGANHNSLKTLPLQKFTFLIPAFEPTLRREACEFCEIHSLWNFFSRILFVFLEKGWTVAHQPTFLLLSVDSGCSQWAVFPVAWRNVLAICYKSLYFPYVFLSVGRQILLLVSVSLSEAGEDALSLALLLVSERWSRPTRRFPVVPAWEGAGSTQPSWTACPWFASQTFM